MSQYLKMLLIKPDFAKRVKLCHSSHFLGGGGVWNMVTSHKNALFIIVVIYVLKMHILQQLISNGFITVNFFKILVLISNIVNFDITHINKALLGPWQFFKV